MNERPAPIATEDSELFWAAAAGGRLVAQRCARCHRLHHPPRPMCPSCGATGHEWVELAGTGTVYSYSLLHHPRHPAFAYPVIAAIVHLDEGIRLVSNLVDIEPGDVRIDLPVEVTFAPTADGRALPVFRPRAKASP